MCNIRNGQESPSNHPRPGDSMETRLRKPFESPTTGRLAEWAKKRTRKPRNQQAITLALKILTKNGIHSDVASSKVATSGGFDAASDDICNVQSQIKSTSVASFTNFLQRIPENRIRAHQTR